MSTLDVESNVSEAERDDTVAPARINAGSSWACVWMLAKREWIRFYRQRNRVIGAIGQPILFWLLFGTGMHASFRGGDQDFMTYFLPGTFALIVLFTAIFTTISIIEDRKEGFLQNVLVAPVPRWTIAMGKILGGGAIAWVQALLFLTLSLLIGSIAWQPSLMGAIAMLGIASLALTALGVIFAWPMESSQGFHAIMSLVLMPMWLLSGAFFPIPAANAANGVGQVCLHWLMRCNPMSYLVAGLRHLFNPQVAETLEATTPTASLWQPSLSVSWMVSIMFLAVAILGAWRIVVRPTKGDLR